MNQMARQRRPIGPLHRASVEWKLSVRRVVDGPGGMSRAELARAAGTTTATISQLLGPESDPPTESSSKLLPAINRALGLPDLFDGNPDVVIDNLHDELTRAWPTLDATERAVIAMIVARRTNGT